MNITDDMLKVAIAKSVEAGLLPRRALKEDFQDARETMRAILLSAFSCAEKQEECLVEAKNVRAKNLRPDKAPSTTKKFIPAELGNLY